MPRPKPNLAHTLTARHRLNPVSTLLGRCEQFGDNPGALGMFAYAPASLPPRAPLVVVLHGCTQTAASYDYAAGWSTLAEQYGFAVLFPEQQRGNNANLCFNWFEAGDTARGCGEAASVVAAVRAMTRDHNLDPSRVFITGLSAGGAMAAALLTTYPDVFAGGAIVAGLPFGTATGVNAALSAMRHPPVEGERALGDKVRAASSFTGPWPRVMIWHGSADHTVAPANGDALATQWYNVHGLAEAPQISVNGRETIERWGDTNGVVQVELHRIAGMGHGTPIDGACDGMHTAPYMLDVGIPSSARIGAFWGIMPTVAAILSRPEPDAEAAVPCETVRRPAVANPRHGGVGETINAALRAAGLLN